MRTTLTLDDDLARMLKAAARRSGRPLRQVVNDTLRAGLAAARKGVRPKPYRLEPASLGGVRAGVNLDKALALAAALEDGEIARELALRK